MRYQTPWGQPAGLSVDVNYVRRVPLWAPTRRDSYRLGRWQATGVPVMDIHELAAGKLRAFYDRSLPRDLYDVGLIPHLPGLDPERLRTAFVVYGASARSDWREVCQTHPVVRASDLASQLGTALLDSEAVRTLPESVDDYRAELTAKAAPTQQMVLPLTRAEQRFLDLVIDHGHVAPEILTDNAALRQRIGAEPWLKWKAINVQQRTIQERPQDQPGKHAAVPEQPTATEPDDTAEWGGGGGGRSWSDNAPRSGTDRREARSSPPVSYSSSTTTGGFSRFRGRSVGSMSETDWGWKPEFLRRPHLCDCWCSGLCLLLLSGALREDPEGHRASGPS